MHLDIYQVDSFTSTPFKGNPACVCITEQELEESLMADIAAEMAVSETAFLSLDNYRLRWFTPQIEVDLCGHATLATVHILKETGLIKEHQIVKFHTLSGELQSSFQGEYIELNFPQATVTESKSFNLEKLKLLGIAEHEVNFIGNFGTKEVIEINSKKALLDLVPDFGGLKKLNGRGIAVTTKSSDKNVDFCSRYFAPWVGIDEDPVNGSSHCALAPYWGKKLNKLAMTGYQSSKRGGFIKVELLDIGRVKLSGKAVTILKGKLQV